MDELAEIQLRVQKNDQILKQIYDDRQEKQNQIKNLEQELDELIHNLYYKSSEIQAIEQFFQDEEEQQQKESEDGILQKKKVVQLYSENTQTKIRQLLQKYWLTRYKEVIDQYFSSSIKLEVQSVVVIFLKAEPIVVLLEQEQQGIFKGAYMDRFEQSFSINKKTKIKDIYNEAMEFWKEEIDIKNCEYVLTDILLANMKLLEEIKVEQFFQQQNYLNYGYAEFFLKEKNIKQPSLLKRQIESIALGNELSVMEQDSEKKAKEAMIEIYKHFKSVKVGMVQYMEAVDEQEVDDNDDQLPTETPNLLTSFFKFGINIAIIVFLILHIFSQIDFEVLTSIKLAESVYFANEAKFGPLDDSIIYDNILNDFYYLEVDNNKKQYLKLQDRLLVGMIRVLQVRTKKKSCLLSNDNQDCAYNNFDENTEETEIINKGQETWENWKSASETNISPYQGLHGYYSGGGYVYDIDPYQTFDQLHEQLKKPKYNKWLNFQTKLISINGLHYDLSRSRFYQFSYYIEINTSGTVQEDLDFYLIRLNYKETDAQIQYYNTQITILVLILVKCFVQIFLNFRFIFKFLNEKQQKHLYFNRLDHIGLFINIQFLLDVWQITNAILAFYYENLLPEKPLVDILNSKEFENLSDIGYFQEVGLKLLAINIFLTTIQLLTSFNLSEKIQILLVMIQNLFKPVIMLLCLYFFIIIGFSVIFQNIFGSSMWQFKNFEYSIYSFSFLVFFGDYDIKKQMDKYDVYFSQLMTVFAVIIFYYSVGSLYYSICHESYRFVSTQKDLFADTIKMKNDLLQLYLRIKKRVVDIICAPFKKKVTIKK